MNSKVCSRCRTDKPFSEYNKNKKSKDGFQSICKLCQKNYSHEYDKGRKNVFNYDDPFYKENKKVCTICGIEKPLLEFGRDHKGTHGLKCKCNVCRKSYYNKKRSDTYNPVVYNIINKNNGEVLYVGETEIPDIRKDSHFNHKSRTQISKLIKSGEVNKNDLIFEIIEYVEDKKVRLDRERYWIQEKKPKYNILKVTS